MGMRAEPPAEIMMRPPCDTVGLSASPPFRMVRVSPLPININEWD